MAEAAGLALSVVALAGVFKDCIDLFSYIKAARALGSEYYLLETRLDVEKTLLLQWAERVGLVQGNRHPRLSDVKIQPAVVAILKSIHLLLSESEELQHRYGLTPAAEEPRRSNQIELSTNNSCRLGDRRLHRFMSAFRDLTIRDEENGILNKVSTIQRVRWAIQDKEKFEELVRKLSDFVAKLNALIPPQQQVTLHMMEEDIQTIAESIKLEVLNAAGARQEWVADTASKALHEGCQQRILDALWSRKMDDRRNDVSTPFADTFSWAFESCGNWSDLTVWLRSESGIYWLSGKAGSGKSTLMKFLYSHPKTLRLLQEWAASCDVTIGSFFFWALGLEEQKSQAGLARAVLYNLLEPERGLIQSLLPSMWRETYASDDLRVSPPSPAEMKIALTRMACLDRTHTRKYCFFIDGLDEYSGKFADGIAFVKALAAVPYVKVIVSSRPIPDCVDAFSSCPRLELQDLTNGDIRQYVAEVVGSHPYMVGLHAAEPFGAASIIAELISKASGVFLWIILACRSLLQGFAAFDRITELRTRVNDLPEELRDLFQHMLSKIERRYQSQAAKLLHVCYANHLCQDSGPLPTLGLALVDEYDMDINRIPAPFHMDMVDIRPKPFGQPLTIRQKVSKCEMLEGRLRSRCWGLLEVRRDDASESIRCFCGQSEKSTTSTVDSNCGVPPSDRIRIPRVIPPYLASGLPRCTSEDPSAPYAVLSILTRFVWPRSAVLGHLLYHADIRRPLIRHLSTYAVHLRSLRTA